MNDLELLARLASSEEFLITLSWCCVVSGIAWLGFGFKMIHSILASWFAAVVCAFLALWLCAKLDRLEYCMRYLLGGALLGVSLGLLFTKPVLYVATSLLGAILTEVGYHMLKLRYALPTLGETGIYVSFGTLVAVGCVVQFLLTRSSAPAAPVPPVRPVPVAGTR